MLIVITKPHTVVLNTAFKGVHAVLLRWHEQIHG